MAQDNLWFSHPPVVDAKSEQQQCKQRDPENWAFLVSRLVSAELDPASTEEDRLAGVPGDLRYSQFGTEAMVYRIRGNPGKPQVLIVQKVWTFNSKTGVSAKKIITEAQRRDKL